MQSELDTSDNPVTYGLHLVEGSASSLQTPKANIVHSFTKKKRIFFSLCFDTMLYGISCVCARAAHIDLVLVPCIGTSIDLEFSIRHCLQNENCSLEPITDCGQASEDSQKIKKRSEPCHQKSLQATGPLGWVG